MLIRSLSAMTIAALISLILVFSWQAIAAQELYKWTDKDGNVHYGDKPPAAPADQSSLSRVATGSEVNTIVKLAVTVDRSVSEDVTRYVLRENEILSSHSSRPARIIISDGILWLPFQDSVLSFNPGTEQSAKYRLDRAQTGSSPRSMHISGNSFIFLEKDRYSTESAFHIYDHVSNAYDKLTVTTTPNYVLLYDDQFGDGIFGFSYHSKSLLQYPNVLGDRDGSTASEIAYSPSGDLSGINGITASRDAIWYISGHKKACTAGFIDKQSQSARHFDSEEIGGSAANGCSSIVADDREVWITSLDPGGARTTFSIYDLQSGEWDTLKKDKDDPGSYAALLQMDSERIYFSKCTDIFAIDRASKRTLSYSTSTPRKVGQSNYCVSTFVVQDGFIWALKFDEQNRGRYPSLYKIPVAKLR